MGSKELLETFYFLEDTFIGEYIRSSIWLFPVIESFHLIGLGILGGSVVVMDLKLMKIIFRNIDKIYIFEQTRKFFILVKNDFSKKNNLNKIKKKINEEGIRLEYLEILNKKNLSNKITKKNYKIFISYYIKNVRMIDNL